MEITKHEQGDLGAVLKLKIVEQDYKQQVLDVLKSYKKRANIPGFRSGKVPIGMLNKMYGASVKADEINKLINNSLYKYIEEKELDILGNPLPQNQDQTEDFLNEKDFEFSYELGLSPKFEVNLSSAGKFTNYQIKVDDQLMKKNIEDLTKRYGKMEPSDQVGEKDMVVVRLKELGTETPIDKQTTIYTEFVENKKEKAKLIGLKKDDTVHVNVKNLAKNDVDLAAMLGVSKEQLSTISNEFELQVIAVQRVIPAEENQELYDKIFGPGKVNGKQEFDDKSKLELEKVLLGFSDKKLKKDVMDALIKKLKLSLPDAFLKKWLLATNKEMTEQKVEQDYEKFASDMRWMLVENQIVKENGIELQSSELQEHAQGLIKTQFEQYGIPVPEEAQLNTYVQNMLSNKEEAHRLRSELIEQKVIKLFREQLTLKDKEVTYTEFEDILQEKTSRFNIFKKFKF